MGKVSLTPPVTLRITEADFVRLRAHLFPGDRDEHGAVLLCGTCTTPCGTRLLVREVILAQDGIDYVPGQHGYRALTANFVARCSDRAAHERLAYVAVHCHGGTDSVAFSNDDMRSHERGYPALVDITSGGPVGALVFAHDAAAGDIWAPGGRYRLHHLDVVGLRPMRLYPAPAARPRHANPEFDRSARLYGDIGQAVLAQMKVAIVGLGGVGSLLNEWMARLGVGTIVAIDPERLDITNLPRVVDASRSDALYWLQRSNVSVIRAIGRRFAKRKVDIAARVARRANPRVTHVPVAGDFVYDDIARLLVDCDFVFLAADTYQCRLVFNAIVQQYLIPGAQAGSKVPVTRGTGQVSDIHTASRLVFPGIDGGCLVCQGLVRADKLQDEALLLHERRLQRYVDDDTVVAPSVITLNAVAAAAVANDFMMIVTRLLYEDVTGNGILHYPRERRTCTMRSRSREGCVWCSTGPASAFARGDSRHLLTRPR